LDAKPTGEASGANAGALLIRRSLTIGLDLNFKDLWLDRLQN